MLLRKPWLAPDALCKHLLVQIINSRVLVDSTRFVWFKQLINPYGIDGWNRYTSIAQLVHSVEKPKEMMTILDVGGEGGHIRRFVNPGRHKISVLDRNNDSLVRIKDSRINAILGDGCNMNLEDDSFDIVLSCDSLEHVPDNKKQSYLLELKRVAKRYVIIHCPVDSADGMFCGTKCDSEFQKWYRNRYKEDEPNTAEHLSSGVPTIEMLKEAFPGCSITGKQNSDVWFSYKKTEYAPYKRFFNALIYKLNQKKKDDTPPYHACLLFWEKR
mgnify:CR=1 FL=1